KALRHGRDAVLRISAACDQRADVVADAKPVDAGADALDGAGNLEPRDVGCAGWRRISSQPLEDVRPVDARGSHLDQDFARCRRRHRPLRRDQHLGAARLLDLDRDHESSPKVAVVVAGSRTMAASAMPRASAIVSTAGSAREPARTTPSPNSRIAISRSSTSIGRRARLRSAVRWARLFISVNTKCPRSTPQMVDAAPMVMKMVTVSGISIHAFTRQAQADATA